jgi:hypothetical protein
MLPKAVEMAMKMLFEKTGPREESASSFYWSTFTAVQRSQVHVFAGKS